ncbi:hypothetical protein K458DRAFT_392534 [Lentithecium fluviatile CBS 122367]|uniref:Uncharacterized protein n=1 Tax=Lentithecium fluviatile CBS 122367 TaxID=1168545 RepID=A0A6G1IRT2_9PLEO|nr:hypothetical protein K458DRAFT_392534 [Lentithecium fluviatile CBS 122367]
MNGFDYAGLSNDKFTTASTVHLLHNFPQHTSSQTIAVPKRPRPSPRSRGSVNILITTFDCILDKLDDLVRPYVHKILVVIEPLLMGQDYYACVEGREIISNLAKTAGLAHMISTMRPDLDQSDDYVRNTTSAGKDTVVPKFDPEKHPLLKKTLERTSISVADLVIGDMSFREVFSDALERLEQNSDLHVQVAPGAIGGMLGPATSNFREAQSPQHGCMFLTFS